MRLNGIILHILLTSAAFVAAERAYAQTAADSTDPQRVALWVGQLSASQYYVRDSATRNLIAAGRAAVESVTKAVDGSDLEVTARGIFVLQQLGLAGDLETEQAARLALEKLASARVTASARRAAAALETLYELKQDKALKQLESLGAKVSLNHTEVGVSNVPLIAVEIGETWRGQEQDLLRLQWLRDVEQVTFAGQRVNDRWIGHIRKMENLFLVKIKRANVTSQALSVLPNLRRLRYVKLLYVPIDDSAVDQLQGCPQLEKLLAYGTQISPGAAERLKALGMDVDRRKGAFLGISVPHNNEGTEWAIGEVTRNSAAEKAGLKAGDVIVKYAGQAVDNFPSLMALIAQNDAGDTVSILVRRNGEILEKKITLGYWD